MTICERCRANESTLVLGNLCLCQPCAETLAWTHGVYAQSNGAPPAPVAAPAPDYGYGYAPATSVGAPPARAASGDGFPWVRVMFVLGGFAALSTVALYLYKFSENAQETRRGIMRVVEKHPEVLGAL